MGAQTNKFNYLAAGAGICVLGLFAYSLTLCAVNVPAGDDYDALLLYLINFYRHPDLISRLSLSLSQHNEHRLAFTRLTGLFFYLIEGQLDFRQMVYFGALSLPCLAVLLALLGRVRGWLFLPLIFLLFEPQYWEALYWAMGSTQNLWVLFFCLASLGLLAKQGPWPLAWAFALAGLACLTSGSGLLLFPAGLVLLLLTGRPRSSLLWAGLSALALAAYFQGYHNPPSHPSPLLALVHPLAWLSYFLSLTGAAPAFSGPLAPYFGLAPPLVFLWLWRAGYARRNPVLFVFFGLLLAMALVAAASRFELGPQTALVPRYRIISLILFGLSYLCPLSLLRPKGARLFGLSAVILSATFCLASYLVYLPNAAGFARALEAGMCDYKQGGRNLAFPDQEKAATLLRLSIEHGYYRPPDADCR